MEQSIEVLLYGSKFRKLYEMQIEETLGEYHLKKVDVEILYFLYHSGQKNTAKDIAGLHLFTKGHISQSVDRLQGQKLLELIPDGSDRRCHHLILTEEAEVVIEKILLVRKKLNEVIFRGVTEQEREMMLQVARKIEKNLNETLERE